MAKIIYKTNSSTRRYPLSLLRSGLDAISKIIRMILGLPLKLLPHRLMRRLNSSQRLFVNVVLGGIFIVFGLWIVTSLLNPEQTKAAWWNDSWRYRQSVTATNASPFAAANIPYRILIDTASLITAGKMKADGSDIRIVNNKGKAVRFQVEQSTLNTTQTGIWFDATVQSDNKALYFIYYGNNQAQAASFPSDIASNVSNGTTVTTQDGYEYTTSTSHGRISDIKKDGVNLGVDGAYRNTGSYPGNWWDDRTFTRTQLASGPMFVEVKFEDTSYGDYSSYGTIVKLFKNGFAENQVYMNYNTSGSEQLYYYQYFDTGTRNSLWVNSSGTLVDQSTNSGALSRALIKDNWFGQRWTDTGNYGGTIFSPITSDWNSGQTSAQSSYYQTNYSTTEAYSNGSSRKIRFGIFAGSGTSEEMHEKGSLLGAQSTSLGSEEQSPAPVAYWSMDEGSGSIVHDKTSIGSNGTISGATWEPASKCKVGKCLYFDGTNDSVDFGNISPRASISGNLTVSFWIKPTNIAKGRQNPLGKAYGGEFDMTMETTGSLTMYHGSAGNDAPPYTQYNSPAISQNEWTHVVYVRDTAARSVKIYLNGRLRTSGTYSSTYDPIASSRSFKFGYEYAGYYQGYLDEVMLFPTVKTQSEINALYSAGNAGVAAVKGISVSAGTDDKSSLNQGLVGYWKMDEASWNGTTGEVVDSSGTGNNGTATDAVASSGAKFGNAGYFSGNAHIIVPNSTSLSFGTGGFTYSTWLYKTSASGTRGDFLSHKTAAGDYDMGYFVNSDNKVWVYLQGATIITSTSTISSNTWYQITVTRSPTGSWNLYINGVLNGSGTNTTTLTNSTDWWLGSNHDNSLNPTAQWQGALDETRLYNRSLSANEVQQLYTYAPGPTAYYPFEESNGATTIADKSSHNLNLTTSGSPTFVTGKYGKAVKFANNSLDGASLSNAFYRLNNYTYGFWFRLDSAHDGAYRQIFSLYGSSDRQPGLWRKDDTDCFHSVQDPTNMGFSCLGPTGNSSSWQTGKWYYYSQTKSGTTVTAYVNGSKIATTTVVDPMTTSTTPTMYLGKSVSYNAAGITLDEFRLYNYARTPGQITEDMNAGHPLGGSPVGSQTLYFKFDEGYGTLAHDSAPSPANGTLSCQGAGCILPEWKQDGKFGKALYFNASDTANNPTITIPSSTYTKLQTLGDVTISAWINPSSSYVDTSQAILREGQGADQEYSLYYSPTNKTISFSWYDGAFKGVSAPNNLVPLNKWSYVAAVRSGTTLYFYVNGKQVGSSTVTAPTVNASQFSIGRTNNTGVPQDYSGYIDELKVYTTALTADNIKIDYNRGASLLLGTLGTSSDGTASSSAGAAYCVPGDTSSCAAPVAEYTFEEGSGTTLIDRSGNGNTGTLTNNPSWAQGRYGKGLRFTGSNYISIPNALTTSKGTLSMWIKPDNAAVARSSTEYLFSNGISEGGTNAWFLESRACCGSPNDLIFYTYKNGTSSYSGRGTEWETNNWAARQWAYVTVTWDTDSGGSFKIYNNGILQASTSTGSTGDSLLPSNLILGGVSGSSGFKGVMDDVRYYNYVRTPAQIAYDYNRGAPLARWKMDECQGSVIHDVSGNGLDGTLTVGGSGTQTAVGTCTTPSTAWGNGATGKFNSSLNFDGTDDSINVGDPPALDITTNDFTLSAWVKTTSTNQQRIISKRDGSTVGYEMLLLSSGKIDFLIGDSGGFTFANLNNTAVNDGNWHLITLVFDRDANVTSYIDGKQDDTVSISSRTGSLASSANVYIGRYSPSASQFFDGQIDDVQIFNYALTPTQIHNLVNQNSSIRYGPSQGTP